jgi:hypothetical protein
LVELYDVLIKLDAMETARQASRRSAGLHIFELGAPVARL